MLTPDQWRLGIVRGGLAHKPPSSQQGFTLNAPEDEGTTADMITYSRPGSIIWPTVLSQEVDDGILVTWEIA